MKKINRTHKKRRPNIFISHSSKDKKLVTKFAYHLNKLGIDGWLDDWELEVGDNLNKRIEDAIARSQYLGIAITPSFIKSDWCNKELKKALAKEKRIGKKVVLPLIFKKAQIPDSLKEERLYLSFDNNYYNELTKLAGMIHRFGRQRIQDSMDGKKLRNITEASRVLKECGWDNTELLDSHYFNELRKLRGMEVRGNVIEFYPDKVRRLNKVIPTELRRLIR